MKLSKFLRANSRTLLMVFMSLLLIAFLIPDTIQSLSRRGRWMSRTFGEAYGRKITDQETLTAINDMRLLATAGMNVALPENAALEYHLLLQEAEQAGVRVGRDEVKSVLGSSGQVTDEHLRRIQRDTRRSFKDIYGTMGRYFATQRLLGLQASAVVDTLPRQEASYRDQHQEAIAQLSVIEDKAFVRLVPEPTDAELQAFFEECRNRNAAHTEQKLEYGYLLPDRVRVEYLTVDPQQIRSAVTLQALQVKRYFEENASRYTKPDPTASQPVGGRVPQIPMTFEEARDRVREDCRTARAIEAAQSLVNDMHAEAHLPWSTAQRGPDGFLTAPTASTSFEDLKTKFSATYEVQHGVTELMSAEQLQGVPGLGSASLTVGRQVSLRVPELALRVKGILAADPNDNLPVLNLMEPAPVVTRPNPTNPRGGPYQAYLLRVTEVAPSAPPATLDEIREDLVRDWKLMKAHELAKQHAETLAARAREIGLAAAVEQATELRDLLAASDQAASQPATPATLTTQYAESLVPVTPERLTRSARLIRPRIGTVQDLPKELFKLAEAPVAEGAQHRAAAFPLATQHRWVVAQVDELKPIYQGEFEAQLAGALRMNWEARRFYSDWWNPDFIKARAGFKPVAEPAPESGGTPQ